MKSIVIIICFLCFFITACGSNKVIDGITYETYGLINENDKKASHIKYEPIYGNIIWGVLLSGTIIAPIWFFGYSMFEPVGISTENVYENRPEIDQQYDPMKGPSHYKYP